MSPVVLVGATGMVGRRCYGQLCNSQQAQDIICVGSSQSVGQTMADVALRKELALRSHYGQAVWPVAQRSVNATSVVVGEDSLQNVRFGTVLSFLSESAASDVEPRILSKMQGSGGLFVSNSPWKRLDKEMFAMVVPEVNPDVLQAALRSGKPLKTPNCCTIGSSIPLAALHARWGLVHVTITTFQSLSGRGDLKYPAESVVGTVLPLAGSQEEVALRVANELKCLFEPEPPLVSVAAHRVPVACGHYLDLRVKLRSQPNCVAEVRECLRSFQPPSQWQSCWTNQPLMQVHEDGPVQPHHSQGMCIHVGSIALGEDDLHDLTLGVAFDNLDRGAFGTSLLLHRIWEAVAPAPNNE